MYFLSFYDKFISTFVKINTMKTGTEKILVAMRIISWVTFISYSFVCGSKIIAFMVSFKNPDLARHLYRVNPKLFNLLQYNTLFLSV